MKIAIVYDAVYPYVIGGGEKRNWEIAMRLAKLGHQVYIVGMKYWQGGDEIVKENVHLVGVCRAVSLYNSRRGRSLFEPFYFAYHLVFYLVKEKFDLIDSGNFPYLSCIAVKIATLFKKTKFVITWYEARGLRTWMKYIGYIGMVVYIFEKIISRLTEYNIVISPFTQKCAINILGIKPENIVLIPCGIEYTRLQQIPSIRKENQIICISRLVKHKRVDLLIEAFSDVIKKFPEYSLKVIGRGPEEKNLKSKTENLGLNNKVLFAGFLDREELEKEVKKSRIFVLSSEREGMGIVIVESMALGTPVIALDSEHSAAKSIIKDKVDGLLVKNKTEMTEAIIQLLTNRQLYDKLVEGSYNTAQNYDWDNSILPELSNFYNQIYLGLK